MKRNTDFFRLALLALFIAVPTGVQAAVSCMIPAGVTLAFGTYDDSLAADTNVSVAFSVSCCRTAGGTQTATMSIDIGPSATSGSISTRQMRNATDGTLMSYQLYFGAFGGTIWGDGLLGGSAYTQTFSVNSPCKAYTAIPVASPIFGTILRLQPVTPGTYTDSLTITVNP